jgi:hypothetical protein
MKFNGMVLGVVMQLMLIDNLLFVEVTIAYHGATLDITNNLPKKVFHAKVFARKNFSVKSCAHVQYKR